MKPTIEATIEYLKEDCNSDYAEVAIEALEKQIPKKVRITTSTKRCGRCNRQLSGIGNLHPKRLYCTGCGQAIDWSEEE